MTMRRITVCAAALGAALLLAGCATRGPVGEIDYAKMAAIDAQAKRVGVSVYWLNMPKKPIKPAAGT